MNAEQRALYERLQTFQFDSSAARPFAARLAQEQNWTPAFTEQSIAEYRRFVLLAVTTGQMVCPSQAVDEVWHLHLLYTRNYWDEFCPQVLGCPLHHEPSGGGPSEFSKHRAMYARTLVLYRDVFDETPPAAIWPDLEARFGPQAPHRRRSVWQFVQRCWNRSKLRGASFLGAGVAFVPVVAVTDPYDWRGPQFLLLYAVVVAAGFALGATIRYFALGGDACEVAAGSLSAQETAYLAGGARRAINVVVAKLTRINHLVLTSSTPLRFRRVTALPPEANSFEQQVHNAFTTDVAGSRVSQVHAEFRRDFGAIKSQLRELGLIASLERNLLTIGIPLLIMAAIVLFGIGKVVVGLDRHRPVSLLAIATAVTAVVSLFAFARPVFRLRSGERYLEQTKTELQSLRSQSAQPDDLSSDQLTLLLSLWGCGVWSGSAYTQLDRFEQNATRFGTGDISSSSSGCGTGCGGGGCGGGGCGGCGS